MDCSVMGRIWMRGTAGACPARRSIFALGIPVRWNDFSQSAVDGPRMFPSM